MEYQSTPDLPDDEGRALLEHLEQLYTGTMYGEDGKKVRRNSQAQGDAVTALQKAILDAANRFGRREEFSAWLCRNMRPDIDAYDPRGLDMQVRRALDDMQWRVKCLEESKQSTDKILMEIALRLPKTQSEAA